MHQAGWARRRRTGTGAAVTSLTFFLVLAFAACAPAPTARPGTITSPTNEAPRTLNLGVRYEITQLAAKWSSGITSGATKRLFNAGLTLVDARGTILPYLAENVPQLNTDSWRVSPDGQMETTYRLRPNLTWHDGRAVTADDFVFAWHMYTNRDLGVFGSSPQDRMAEATAPDPRTLIIRWRTLYPDADHVGLNELAPLPQRILGDAFSAFERDPAQQDALVNHPYWAHEFVGVGPYRLAERIEGASVEAIAFEGHALGPPKIDRIIVHFIGDENTMLTNLLSENVDVALDNSLRYEHAVVLKRDWSDGQKGTVLLDPVQPRLTNIQLRPEYANPQALLDVRVRRALAYSLDKRALIDGLFEGGDVPLADQFLPATIPYFQDMDRGITKYPYDLKQADQLLGEIGYRKGTDSGYASPTGERFAFEHWVIAGSQNERQSAIMADGWRRAGFDVKEYAIPSAQSTNGEVRGTFPSLSSVATGGGETNLNFLSTAQIPSPANRWSGNNRGAWSNPDYDRLWESFLGTLDRAERNRQAIEMMRLATQDVAMLFLFHNPDITAFWGKVQGPTLGSPDAPTIGNVYQWELR
ncbi:MAG TPA: ABC transporter substrate-binding protein [Chloroflexota bacterium]